MGMLKKFIQCVPLFLAVTFFPASPAISGQCIVYVGTLSRGTSKGIYAFRFDSGTGKLDSLGLAAEIVNPAFLAFHPKHRVLYAVGNNPDSSGQNVGMVSAFSIDPNTARLTLINKVPAHGSDPTYVCTDKTGKNLLVANYVGGNVAVIKIRDDGGLGETSAVVQHSGSSVHLKRQFKPFPHCIMTSPDNRFVLVSDLGLDQIVVYRFDAKRGLLEPNDPPFVKLTPGAGPRHFAFHPNGRFLYSINELQSTVTVFAYDASKGTLVELQTVTALPDNWSGESTASEVLVHPNGRFLYGANRGHNSIAVFPIDRKTGTLKSVEWFPVKGRPRNFRIDPSGTYLVVADQDSHDIVLLRIDRRNGRLQETGQSAKVSWPWCVKYLPWDKKAGKW